MIAESIALLHLEEQYQVLVCIDLADITTTHHAVYQVLAKAYKAEYGPRERIVFYSSHTPPHDLLAHINIAAETFNIDPTFIIIITAAESKPLEQGYKKSSKICPLAYGHVEVDNYGNIKPCCVYQGKGLGNIKNITVSQALRSPDMIRMRNELEQGIEHSGCRNCWVAESRGAQSNRQWALSKTGVQFYNTWISDIKIRSIDIKAGNTCNFKCRICNPMQSSLFAEEARKLKQWNMRPSGNWFDDSDFIDSQLLPVIKDIEYIEFYGGEPFLSKRLDTLLQNITNLGFAHKINLHFNTNGSVYPSKLIPLLEQFKSVDIAVSIDNIGQRFELERGSTWIYVEKNIKHFKEHAKLDTYLFPTVNIQNILYLDELMQWARDNQLRIKWNILQNPHWLSIFNVTLAAQELIQSKYENADPHLQYLASIVSAKSDGSEFVKYMQEFDHIRNQDFSLTHKEIAVAMGYKI